MDTTLEAEYYIVQLRFVPQPKRSQQPFLSLSITAVTAGGKKAGRSRSDFSFLLIMTFMI
jgi:hypothetical protein